MNTLQSIFTDHYEEILYTLHPHKTEIENHCGELKFSPFRCKSRFCPFCGNKYNQQRSFSMSCKLISCTHRHCVFTIPEELRIYFLRDRSLLNCLFHSVRDVILRMFAKINKTEHFIPGFICVLHTFGRDLKWNLFPDSFAISRKSSLKCSVTMAFMPGTTNRVPSFFDVCLPRKKLFSEGTWIGVIRFFCLLDMTLSVVQNVILLWWFWKYTTKKLHYLNNTERSWDMDKSTSSILLFTVK